MLALYLVADELKLLGDNVQVWPRAHIQARLFNIRTQILKLAKRSKAKPK